MRKTLLYCLAVFVSAILFTDCSKEETDAPLPNPGKGEDWTPKVEVEQQSYVGNADGGTMEVRMKANGNPEHSNLVSLSVWAFSARSMLHSVRLPMTLTFFEDCRGRSFDNLQ